MMKATLKQVQTTRTHDFEIEVNNELLYVTITTNDKGRFLSTLITDKNGDMLDVEGSEGELHEEILNLIDAEWDNLHASL